MLTNLAYEPVNEKTGLRQPDRGFLKYRFKQANTTTVLLEISHRGRCMTLHNIEG